MSRKINIFLITSFIKETCRWLWALDTRTAEWYLGNVLVANSISIMIFDSHLVPSPLSDRLPFLGPICLFSGILLWIMIIYNGRLVPSPYLRASTCAMASSILLTEGLIYFNEGLLPPALLLFSMAVSGIYCTINIMSRVKVKSKKESPICLLYTSPSPRDGLLSRMPSSA